MTSHTSDATRMTDDPFLNFDLSRIRQNQVLPTTFKAPLFMSIEMTYSCPLRCIHCYNDSAIDAVAKRPELERAELERLMDYIEASQVIGVCVTGGDALLNPNFWYVAERLKQMQHTKATTISSGWLVTEAIAERLADCFHGVQVSIDGATAAMHNGIRGRSQAFQRATRTLRHLGQHRVRRLIGFTAMRRNYHQLDAMIELAENLGVDMVEVMPLMSIGRAYLYDGEPLVLSADQEQELVTRIAELKNMPERQVRIHYANTFPQIMGFIQDGLPGVFMHICADGVVKMLPQFSVSFGNIRTDTLDNIWTQRLGPAWSSTALQRYVSGLTTINELPQQERIPYVDDNISYDDLQALYN